MIIHRRGSRARDAPAAAALERSRNQRGVKWSDPRRPSAANLIPRTKHVLVIIQHGKTNNTYMAKTWVVRLIT